MPAGPRIRSNNEFGLITDNPLTAGSTSFNSARLALFPVVAAAHAVVTLDPRAQFGEPEIVVITSHSAAATVATITRGTYGTVARSHPQGTEWVHAPLGEDVIDIVTSGTRPGDPYAGQMIFETDTSIYVARNAANSAWVEALPIGAWQSYTPSFTNFTLGSGTVNGRYTRIGRTIHWAVDVVLSGSTMGSSPTISFPVTLNTTTHPASAPVARLVMADTGTSTYAGEVRVASSTTGLLISWNASATHVVQNSLSMTSPFSWADTDRLLINGTYEAAS